METLVFNAMPSIVLQTGGLAKIADIAGNLSGYYAVMVRDKGPQKRRLLDTAKNALEQCRHCGFDP